MTAKQTHPFNEKTHWHWAHIDHGAPPDVWWNVRLEDCFSFQEKLVDWKYYRFYLIIIIIFYLSTPAPNALMPFVVCVFTLKSPLFVTYQGTSTLPSALHLSSKLAVSCSVAQYEGAITKSEYWVPRKEALVTGYDMAETEPTTIQSHGDWHSTATLLD